MKAAVWVTVLLGMIGAVASVESQPQVAILDEYGQHLHPEVWKASEQGSRKDMSQGECQQSGEAVDSLCHVYGQGSQLCTGMEEEHERACLAYAKEVKI